MRKTEMKREALLYAGALSAAIVRGSTGAGFRMPSLPGPTPTRTLTDADRAQLAAAQEKRMRKAAKRAATVQ